MSTERLNRFARLKQIVRGDIDLLHPHELTMIFDFVICSTFLFSTPHRYVVLKVKYPGSKWIHSLFFFRDKTKEKTTVAVG